MNTSAEQKDVEIATTGPVSPPNLKNLRRRQAGILHVHDLTPQEISSILKYSVIHCNVMSLADRENLASLAGNRLNSVIDANQLKAMLTLDEIERNLVVDWVRLNPGTKSKGNGSDVSRETGSQGDSATMAGDDIDNMNINAAALTGGEGRPRKANGGVEGEQSSSAARKHCQVDNAPTPPPNSRDVLKQRLDIAASLYSLYDRKMRLYTMMGKGMGVPRTSTHGNKGSHTHSPIDAKKSDSQDYYAGLDEGDLVRDTEEQIKLLSARLKELRAGLKKQQEVTDAG